MTLGRQLWIASIMIISLASCQQSSSQGNQHSPGPDLSIGYDLAILDGDIYDGTGAKARSGSILIQSDTIAFIGEVDTALLDIRQIIDATGLVVSPGFIDPHAHGDPMDQATTFENFLAMGVTTIALGQDGSSPIARVGKTAEDYFVLLEEKQHSLNIAMMTGHGSLRGQADVPSGRAANLEERERMSDLLHEHLAAGCFGISSGLEYVPGLYADSTEMVTLAKVVGLHNGVMMSHIRSEDDHEILSSISELGWCSAFCRTHVSHLKITYAKDLDRASEVLQLIENQALKGNKMTAEVYPYSASYTGIGIVFPKWAKTPTDFAIARRERNAELREFLHNKVIQRNGPEATLFGTGPFAGSTLGEIAKKSGKNYVDVLMDLGPFGASGAYFVMNDSVQDLFTAHPEIAVCSDGSPTMRHPRGYGSFARIIEKYVNSENKLSLESAIHKMTALPASIINMDRRGSLKKGYFADVVVFDPAQIKENATWKNPFQLASGMEHVIINGIVHQGVGKAKSTYSGQVLYSN